MSGTNSSRWYFADWMSDPCVRACSLAARGLWMDMLCIASANSGKDYGFVMVAGRILAAADIARMVGATVEEVTGLLSEQAKNGVYSTDRRGAMYCRRMVRAEKSRRNGQLGGNPNLMKNKENKNPVGVEPKPHILQNYKATDSEESLFAEEAAKESVPKPVVNPKPKGDWPNDYREQFWKTYPRKTEKKAAMAKLDALAKSGTLPWKQFIDGVEGYVRYTTGTEERYIKHPTTWINRGCWDDQRSPQRGGVSYETDRRSDGKLGFAGIAEVARRSRLARETQHGDADDHGSGNGRGSSEPSFFQMEGDGKTTVYPPRHHR